MTDAPMNGQTASKSSNVASSSAQWDTSTMTTSLCEIASVSNKGSAVVLNFGVRNTAAESGETGVQLLHSLALNRQAATHLQQLLNRLIVDYQARFEKAR
jgi:hypothetical protein